MAKLDFLREPIVKNAKELMETEFSRKRKDGTLSKVHDESHCRAVATYGGITARALMEGQGYTDLANKSAMLTSVAGFLHDYHREAIETKAHGPSSANFCKEQWNTNELWSQIESNEFDAIYRSVKYHESNFRILLEIFGDPIQGQKQQILPAVIAFSLVTGDAAPERSGYRILERRAFFVGKERMEKDLKMFKYPEESHLAVLGETLRRLYAQNPIDTYPEWLKPYGQELHAVQYLFLRGLLEFTGMTETQAAKFMHEKAFPKYKEEEIAEIVESQRHLDGKYFSLDQYPVLARKIDEVRTMVGRELADLAESSYRLVRLFAEAESPEEAIKSYPAVKDKYQLSVLDKFFEGIVAYREGSEDFVGKFEVQIRSGVEKLVG